MPRRRKHVMHVDEKTIGERLRDLRGRRGDTQVEIAKKIGLTQGLVSAYERGELRVHGALLATFAKALGSSPNEILGFERIEADGLLRDRRFLRRVQKIDQLSKRRKQALLKSLDMLLKGAEVS